MKLYLAGPISGDPDYKRKFNAAENKLIIKGHIVLNPARLPEGMSPGDYMRICFAMIDCADGVVLLPGWIGSQGAMLEFRYANYIYKPTYMGADSVLPGGEIQ